MPKHGLARDRVWVLTTPPDDDAPLGPEQRSTAAVLEASLTDDAATRAIWPHPFELSLRMTAAGARLDLRLQVANTGQETFTFTAALHAYLAAEPGATLRGLDASSAEDNAAGLAQLTLPAGPLPATAERDLAVRNLPGEVQLVGASGTTTLRRNGFADLVVWNPGPGHALADMPSGPADFVCLEPAQLAPVTVVPGQTWTASATFERDVPSDQTEERR